MIRQAIQRELYAQGISQTKCVWDNNLDQSSFNNYLHGRRSLPVDDLEKVLKYLKLEILKLDI